MPDRSPVKAFDSRPGGYSPSMLTDFRISQRLTAWCSLPDRVLRAWAYFGQFGDDMFDDPEFDEMTLWSDSSDRAGGLCRGL